MKKPKNVVWIMCDQLRFDYLGFTGNKIARTPNLDELAGDGVVFDNMFVQYPACMASRASMLTGRYPSTIRMSNGSPFLDPRETTLPEILQRNKFNTALFGKLHIIPQLYTQRELKTNKTVADASRFMEAAALPAIPEDPAKKNYGFQKIIGFEDGLWGEYLEWLDERDPELCKKVATNGFKSKDYIVREVPAELPDSGVSIIPSELHPSTFIAESAVEYFDHAHKTGSCFMQVSFVDPHHPWDPPADTARHFPSGDMPLPKHNNTGNLKWPESLLEKQKSGQVPSGNISDKTTRKTTAYYHAMIEMIDISVGKVIKAIKDAGEYDDTLFIFASDHGEHLGSNGLWRKGYFLYDHIIRSPFFMTWKNGFADGIRNDELYQALDIAPTILDLLDLPIPVGMQGKSFANVLKGKKVPGREYIYCQGAYAPLGSFIDSICIRTRDAKLNYFPSDGFGHLFDLRNDPDEMNDLYESPEYQDLRKQMLELYIKAFYDQRDPLPLVMSQW